MFLRNHDELTLEMVTDEERDYDVPGLRFATARPGINLGIRRRLAPLLKNDRRRIELMNAPAVLAARHAGDLLRRRDRHGRQHLPRRPQRRAHADAMVGRPQCGIQSRQPAAVVLPVIIDPEYHYEAVNVDTQQQSPASLLWWMKRLIALRKEHRAFGRGTIEFLRPDNHKVLAFIRRHEEETILVVANLSRFVQYAELDLSTYRGQVPFELFGQAQFPAIGELPYLLTVGPHGFYWFALHPAATRSGVSANTPREIPAPRIAVRESWEELLEPMRLTRLEPALRNYLSELNPTLGTTRSIRGVRIVKAVRLSIEGTVVAVLLLEAEPIDGEPQLRAIPLGFAGSAIAAEVPPGAIVATIIRANESAGVLFDARTDSAFCAAVLRAIAANRHYAFDGGELVAKSYAPFEEIRGPDEIPRPIVIQQGERRHVSTAYGNRLILKSFDRLETGPNPALELGRFLTEHTGYDRAAPVVGSVELRMPHAEPVILSVLFGFVMNEGNAWVFTLDALSRFYETVLTGSAVPPALAGAATWIAGTDAVPSAVRDRIGAYLETAEQLGRNTAAMHRALASATTHPGIAPEPFNRLYQRSIYQSMRTAAKLVLRELARRLSELPADVQPLARTILEQESHILRRQRAVLGAEITGYRIRCHGDYHLGQLVCTGSDFRVIDFEGDPDRPMTERRIKRSPLRDVADMIRSFHYAALSPLYGVESGRSTFPGRVREADHSILLGWAHFWATWVSTGFVQAYFHAMADSGLLPSNPNMCRNLLELFVQEKAVRELGGELVDRSVRVAIPLLALTERLAEPPIAEPQ